MAATQIEDSDSDFGYDFTPEDEQLLLQLGSRSPPRTAPSTVNAVDGILDAVPGRTEIIHDGSPEIWSRDDIQAHLALGRGVDMALPPEVDSRGLLSSIPLGDVATNANSQDAAVDSQAVKATEPDDAPAAEEDARPPIQRFRTYPRKPLTVTDLTSGAWCELQYWYTLTRLPGGRRTRTAAMKQGTKVHKKLEDEVHTVVEVEVMTKEDGFGLKLWNFVQGLRTLRDAGLTRELEVWGMVDGNLVNGVIDELSHQNPNPQFEQELSSQDENKDTLSQSILTDYFRSKAKSKSSKKVYLADIKTRGTLTPVSKALLRPAKIQLLLYHTFLGDMAAGQLDFFKVLRRYGLDADASFSDTFIAHIASLHEEVFVNDQEDREEQSKGSVYRSPILDDLQELQRDVLKYQSLRELLKLVKEELALTLPDGKDSIGHMLNVKYIYRGDGREIDTHDFPYSKEAMEDYLAKYMSWWRGERKADGVQIEEAFKCRTCEFVADCTWRQKMDDERVKHARQRASSRNSVV